MREIKLLLMVLAGLLLVSCKKEIPTVRVPSGPADNCEKGQIVFMESGKPVTVDGCVGMISVFVDVKKLGREQAAALIARHKGKILDQMPEYGVYLVDVGRGGEAAFISAMKNIPGVLDAMPEGFSSASDSHIAVKRKIGPQAPSTVPAPGAADMEGKR